MNSTEGKGKVIVIVCVCVQQRDMHPQCTQQNGNNCLNKRELNIQFKPSTVEKMC